MTRFELLKKGTKKVIAEELCKMIELTYDDCDKCPATEYCRIGHTGFLDWIDKEAEYEASVGESRLSKLEVGLALQHIAMSLDDENYSKIKNKLDFIEQAIIDLYDELEGCSDDRK